GAGPSSRPHRGPPGADSPSLHDALPIWEEFRQVGLRAKGNNSRRLTEEYGLSRYSLKLEFDHYVDGGSYHGLDKLQLQAEPAQADRKSTRLHSSHVSISYAVFCLIKQNK